METFFWRKLVATLAAAGLASGLIAGVALPAQASTACNAATGFAGGDGSPGSPYQIAAPGQLQWLTKQLNTSSSSPFATQHFVVTANLNFAGCTFEPSVDTTPFKGSFDGGNRTISNYVIDLGASSDAAIFGETRGAVFKNTVIDGATVKGGNYVAALVAFARQEGATPTTFENITVKNATIEGAVHVGGIVGAALSGSGNSLNSLLVETSEITGLGEVGGLIGSASGYPSLKKSGFFGGKIIRAAGGAQGSGYGGLIGGSSSALVLEETSFRGEIDLTAGDSQGVGFLIGGIIGSHALTVTDSYAKGVARVRPATVVAGFIGQSTGTVTLSRGYVRISVLENQTETEVQAHPFSTSSATLTTMLYDSESHTSWLSTPAGAAKTATEMETYSTFGPLPAWGFESKTNIENGADSAPWYWDDALEGKLFLSWEYSGKNLTPCPPGGYSFNAVGPCEPVPAGSFNAFSGRMSFEPCPIGFFQTQTGGTGCDPATPGFFVAAAGQTTQTPCPAGTTSGVGAASCFAVGVYQGPLVSGSSVGAAGVSAGDQVVLSGSRLGQVSSVSVSGVTALASCSEASCEFVVPEGVSAGLQDLVLSGSHGVLTIQDGIRINPAPAALPDGLRVWTRDQGDGTVKVYARDVVGVGKVQFLVNGREVAWVRATDSSDPKLRTPSAGPMAGVSYLVRSVPLVAGKNVIEVHVSGERVLRRVASGR